MAGTPHDVLVTALRDRPALLAKLVKLVARRSIEKPVAALDSTVRAPRSIEVRPDLILRNRRRGWAIVEVQNRIDKRKHKSWTIAVAQLIHEHNRMGDLFGVTASRRVAAWAAQAAHFTAEAGTRLELSPVVVLIADGEVEALLDPKHPELALFAVWAMQKRRGTKARAIVDRAMELVKELPEPLQNTQAHAIFGVLSEPMIAYLKERNMMDPSKMPLSPAARSFLDLLNKKGKAEGKAEGKQEALLAILDARGLELTARDRARIQACMRLAELDRWIKSAATASSVREVLKLEPAPAKTKRTAAPKATVSANGRRSRKRSAG